jgi:hypothetical protein
MSDSLFELEYHPGEEVVLRFKYPKMKLLPEETKGHLATARKEILMALRDMLNAAVEKAPEKEQPAKRKRKIEVK